MLRWMVTTLLVLVCLGATAAEGSTEGPISAELPLDVREYDGEGKTDSGVLPENSAKVPLRDILLQLPPLEGRNITPVADTSINKNIPGSVSDVSLSLSVDEKNKTKPSSKKVVCLPSDTDDEIKLLNATGLQAMVFASPNFTTRSIPSPCSLVFFFSDRCPFSVAAVPHINALHRHLQGIMPVYAVDSNAQHSINAQYGVMGTPSLLLFHGSYSVIQYNLSTYSNVNLASFLHSATDFKMGELYNLTDADHQSKVLPLEVIPASPMVLLTAWMFLLSVASYCFVKSNIFDAIFEAILNSWREAEAHQHQD